MITSKNESFQNQSALKLVFLLTINFEKCFISKNRSLWKGSFRKTVIGIFNFQFDKPQRANFCWRNVKHQNILYLRQKKLISDWSGSRMTALSFKRPYRPWFHKKASLIIQHLYLYNYNHYRISVEMGPSTASVR